MSAPTLNTQLASGWAATAGQLVAAEAALAAARTDRLTGVLGRDAWMAVAREWFERPVSDLLLVLLDLDHLKPINDRYGHPAGDLALSETGARLQAFAQRRPALVGRLGGDEFAVLLVGGHPADVADLETSLNRPVARLGQSPLPVGASLGAARATEGPTCTVSGAMRAADRSMYAHKRARRAAPRGA